MSSVAKAPVEPPYGIIADHFKEGDVVPFLGAGASLGIRPSDAEFKADNPRFPPTARELATLLGDKCSYPEDPVDLAQVASYFQIRAKRYGLARALRQVFGHTYGFGPIHELLADIDKPLLIITTNYDDLIEQAFRDRRKPFHLVTHPEGDELGGAVLWWKPDASGPVAVDAKRFVVDPLCNVIYKMHGSIAALAEHQRWDSFIITEDDYVQFLSRMTGGGNAIPHQIMYRLRYSALLFMGYGLRDWNLRVLLERLRKPFSLDELRAEDPRLMVRESPVPFEAGGVTVATEDLKPSTGRASQKPSWAIQRSPTNVEFFLWQHRDVQLFDQDLTEFARKMRKYL